MSFVPKFLSLIWWLLYVLLIVWFRCKCLCLAGTVIKNLLTYLLIYRTVGVAYRLAAKSVTCHNAQLSVVAGQRKLEWAAVINCHNNSPIWRHSGALLWPVNDRCSCHVTGQQLHCSVSIRSLLDTAHHLESTVTLLQRQRRPKTRSKQTDEGENMPPCTLNIRILWILKIHEIH